MLERILKPEKKTVTPIARAVKRERESSPNTPVAKPKEICIRTPEEYPKKVAKIEAPSIAVVKQEPISQQITTQSDYKDDMDFSILEDDENQFENEQSTEDKEKEREEKARREVERIQKETKTFESLVSNWENIEDDDELLSSVVVDDIKCENEMKFWFWDAWEDPKNSGRIYLFGKMPLEKKPNEFKSVCLTVENVDRCLYFLPRETVSSWIQFEGGLSITNI